MPKRGHIGNERLSLTGSGRRANAFNQEDEDEDNDEPYTKTKTPKSTTRDRSMLHPIFTHVSKLEVQFHEPQDERDNVQVEDEGVEDEEEWKTLNETHVKHTQKKWFQWPETRASNVVDKTPGKVTFVETESLNTTSMRTPEESLRKRLFPPSTSKKAQERSVEKRRDDIKKIKDAIAKILENKDKDVQKMTKKEKNGAIRSLKTIHLLLVGEMTITYDEQVSNLYKKIDDYDTSFEMDFYDIIRSLYSELPMSEDMIDLLPTPTVQNVTQYMIDGLAGTEFLRRIWYGMGSSEPFDEHNKPPEEEGEVDEEGDGDTYTNDLDNFNNEHIRSLKMVRTNARDIIRSGQTEENDTYEKMVEIMTSYYERQRKRGSSSLNHYSLQMTIEYMQSGIKRNPFVDASPSINYRSMITRAEEILYSRMGASVQNDPTLWIFAYDNKRKRTRDNRMDKEKDRFLRKDISSHLSKYTTGKQNTNEHINMLFQNVDVTNKIALEIVQRISRTFYTQSNQIVCWSHPKGLTYYGLYCVLKYRSRLTTSVVTNEDVGGDTHVFNAIIQAQKKIARVEVAMSLLYLRHELYRPLITIPMIIANSNINHIMFIEKLKMLKRMYPSLFQLDIRIEEFGKYLTSELMVFMEIDNTALATYFPKPKFLNQRVDKLKFDINMSDETLKTDYLNDDDPFFEYMNKHMFATVCMEMSKLAEQEQETDEVLFWLYYKPETRIFFSRSTPDAVNLCPFTWNWSTDDDIQSEENCKPLITRLNTWSGANERMEIYNFIRQRQLDIGRIAISHCVVDAIHEFSTELRARERNHAHDKSDERLVTDPTLSALFSDYVVALHDNDRLRTDATTNYDRSYRLKQAGLRCEEIVSQLKRKLGDHADYEYKLPDMYNFI